ncbi:MAG: hypothetical protein GXO79_15770 [Chlorobi bacterium]|nr:hypothetical protein [Chlorobiota bacterium]
MKINSKMLVFILTTTLIIYAVALGYVSMSARKTTFNDATKLVNIYAVEYAGKIAFGRYG